MEKKHNKTVMAVLIIFLTVSLIWVLICALSDASVELSKLISSNLITRKMRYIYWDGLLSFISIPISFANVIFAIKGLHTMYKEKTSTSKLVIGYLIYVIISLGAIVVHWITFKQGFMNLISG